MAPSSKMALGIKRASRSNTYHRRGLWAIKAKNGGAFAKAATPAAVSEPKFYPADDVYPADDATRNLPDFKKDDQKAIDAELIKAIEAVPELKNYLSARFSLRDGDKPHKFLSLGSVLPSLFLNFVPS
ncbi:hypothetical protein QYE76_031903 [Lolium multiflorum]|uniref:Ribosomal protein L6 N-terminal domain-containing protein n=1 Tax=Lolium multiflorum TaxID=4521 RepID=A0AAD8QTQ7_LOLMU|nr:hypothetical protein QYE76_031903 [Lolium multiflorum]